MDTQKDFADKTLSTITWRILPFVMVLAVLSYIDRANLAFAALEMNRDLGFSATVYGLGAGIFFLGYCFFEVPSNLVLIRVGVRRWIATICIAWGICAVGMAWVSGETSFYVLRFFLGVAEAGIVPAVMYYLRHWYPSAVRAKVLAIFWSFTAISNVIGGPLATFLMTATDGMFAQRGWQLMFVIEGVPSILAGIAVLYWFVETPKDAKWLSAEQKKWLAEELDKEVAAQGARGATTLRQGLLDPRVLMMTGILFFMLISTFGIVFWLPQIIKAMGNATVVEIGLLSALPYALAGVAMIFWGRNSDRTGDRKWHVASALFFASGGLAVSSIPGSPVISFVGLCMAVIGIWSSFGAFWALSSDFLSGHAAASGLALINSGGALGAFVGPYVFGFIRDATGSFSVGLLGLAGAAAAAALIAATLRNEWRPSRQSQHATAVS